MATATGSFCILLSILTNSPNKSSTFASLSLALYLTFVVDENSDGNNEVDDDDDDDDDNDDNDELAVSSNERKKGKNKS